MQCEEAQRVSVCDSLSSKSSKSASRAGDVRYDVSQRGKIKKVVKLLGTVQESAADHEFEPEEIEECDAVNRTNED